MKRIPRSSRASHGALELEYTMDLTFMAFSRLAFGHWEGQPLYAVAELRLADCLQTPMTSAELATRLSLPQEPLERLLDCAVAQKLLTCEGQHYTNTELSRRFLTKASEESLLSWLRVMDRWKTPWASLSNAVRQGHAVDNQAKWLGEDPQFMRDFILGMHQFASRSATQFAQALDGLPIEHLVDVGGGAGTYSIALCVARPHARATVLDLPAVLEITHQTAHAAGVGARVATQVVDYRSDELGSGACAVLFSNVLHQEDEHVCQSMLARAHRALRAGGTLLVQGYFLAQDRRAPVFTTLHNLSALALWDGGRSWTLADLQARIQAAGFTHARILTQEPSGFCLLAAQKD